MKILVVIAVLVALVLVYGFIFICSLRREPPVKLSAHELAELQQKARYGRFMAEQDKKP